MVELSLRRNALRARLGPTGIWTRQLDSCQALEAEAAARRLEEWGCRTLWIPEASRREVLTHAMLLLGATEQMMVATGIARVHARSPQAVFLAERLFDERFPDRFLLGLGVSHPFVVERMLGQQYGKPLATMEHYLDSMDHMATVGRRPRLLAALGPRMLRMAAERADGAHTYLAPVTHTAWARAELGPDALLVPAIKAVVTDDRTAGEAIGRASVEPTLRAPAYRANLLRFGFTEDELQRTPSERVVDALVVIGDADAVLQRTREHLRAGADHVCIEVLTGDDITVPLDSWHEILTANSEAPR